MSLILASESMARRAMLSAAGIEHEAMAPHVDEAAAKQAFAAQQMKARDVADGLAELKAMKLSARYADKMVLGADQLLETEDGQILDKPQTLADAKEHLLFLRGKKHRLISAAVIAQGGRPVWRVVDVASLTMRDFSDGFLDSYLEKEWPEISSCVGCYRLEGPGVQLFSRIDGNYFTILGLPLLPLCDYLRLHGVLMK